MENKYLDIDFVSWKASVGRDDEPLIVNTWQASHPAFVYAPADAWTTNPPSVSNFIGATGHASSSPGASVQLNFQGLQPSPKVKWAISVTESIFTIGDAIAIYGPSGPNGASYHRTRQLLYYGATLGPGNHSIILTLEQIFDRSGMLAIDYAEIYTTPSLGGSFDNATPSPSSGGPQVTALIVGIAITGTLALLVLGLLAFLFVSHKYKGRLNSTPTISPYPNLQPYNGVTSQAGEGSHAHSSFFPESRFTSLYSSPLTDSAPAASHLYPSLSGPLTLHQDSSAIAAAIAGDSNLSQGAAFYRPCSFRKGQVRPESPASLASPTSTA
ncbi:hypothetical protein EST38_g3769 [Candolleomyces aberdarensis]|uniref:Transmembrane protein n=1 Tax=Candolleomyces aberdarensis TaxID=2316362 RepID=A0A4Q2DRB0_9AGAR|nr:hypothetical protein EST38_g3769 [Candolleomyces aberdarensis]